MGELPDEVCPESKITPQISRNPTLGMPITAVIIDEVQVFVEDTTRQDVGARKTTIGAYIADLLTYLAKKGPAARNHRHPRHPTPRFDNDATTVASGARIAIRITSDGLAGFKHHPR